MHKRRFVRSYCRKLRLSPRMAALLLAAGFAPAAFAFPPCPVAPVDFVPVDAIVAGTPDGATSNLFVGTYGLFGNPSIISLISPARANDAPLSPDSPSSGKCRDVDALPVPTGHVASSAIGLAPSYAPSGGFGMIALPDVRTTAQPVRLREVLSFSVDNQALAANGDWIDVAQLEFQWTAWASLPYPQPLATVYRVRKRQYAGGPALEVIEARAAAGNPATHPPVGERTVATLPIAARPGFTRISLVWTQAVAAPGASANVDASLQVLNDENKSKYRVDLPGQRATALSMGLLNYNAPDAGAYANRYGALVNQMYVSASTY